MQLQELLSTYRPETHGRNENWHQHAERLWREEGEYMLALKNHMRSMHGWYYHPVIVDDGVVQDGHHRLVIAWTLGWRKREIPLVNAF